MEILWLLTLCTLSVTICANEDVVKITEGFIRGSIMTSFQGRRFLAYRGIPYAESPTGSRRFKPPQLKSPWTGIMNATNEGSVCPQLLPSSEDYVGNEDCLFVNVYSQIQAKRNPVIVWVHGGGFIFGDGGISLTGPEYLMDHDIVLVTFNYRLGPLGFLSTGDSVLSGNYGLKDAVSLLQWVQRNIEAFGGNPKLVTVFGYSSGAANAHSLTLSPLAKGLFHRVVFESGSSLHQWAFKSSPISVAQKVAESIGCQSTDTSENIANCLMIAPVEKLIRTLYNFPYRVIKMPLPYGIVAEIGNDASDPPFMTESPLQIIQKGQVLKVPAITGVTSAEDIAVSYLIKQSDELAAELDEQFDEIIMKDLLSSNITKEITDKVKRFYLGEKPIKEVNLQQLIELFSDVTFNYGAYKAALAHSQATDMPTYVYKFSFEGRLSSIVLDKIHPTPLGVTHADDLFYVFGRGVDFPGNGPNPDERRTIMRLTKMLADFALTGDPTPEVNDLISVKWLPMDAEKQSFQYLEINKELSMHSGPFFPERISFLESLFTKKTHDEL